MTRRELAAAVGIRHKTLGSSLWPSGRPPGRANLEKLQQWLEAAEPEKATTASNCMPASRGSEVRPRPELPRRLSREQRETLAAHVALDGLALRAMTGVGEDGIGVAVSGGDLGAEAFDRLSRFLASHPQQPATAG